ncbi:MAG: hypothetical protein ACFFEE_01310 [Candidatus Thorarchaeota archaeon]
MSSKKDLINSRIMMFVGVLLVILGIFMTSVVAWIMVTYSDFPPNGGLVFFLIPAGFYSYWIGSKKYNEAKQNLAAS